MLAGLWAGAAEACREGTARRGGVGTEHGAGNGLWRSPKPAPSFCTGGDRSPEKETCLPKATAGVSVELGVEFWVNLPKAKSGTAQPSYFE